MRQLRPTSLILVLLLFAGALSFAEDNGPDWTKLIRNSIWSSTRIDGETLLFVRNPGDHQISAQLMFTPTKIIAVTSANGAITFREGKDFDWKPETRLITLREGTSIPSITWAELHPPKGSPHSLGESADGKSALFFQEPGDLFQSLEVAVTYDHAEKWSGRVPQSARENLKNSIAKLKAKKLNLVVFGDSVSAGAGASGNFHAPPNQPRYTDLVAEGLRSRYGADVSLKNLAEGGQDSTWAVKMAYKAADENPDLVIVGFGGNDCTRGITAKDFAHNIQTVIHTIREKSSSADFILIATMTANPDWPESKATLCRAYRDALFGLTGPGVAVADESSVWQEMVDRKKFLDLSANGINHPNDFGHRVYAQVVLHLFD